MVSFCWGWCAELCSRRTPGTSDSQPPRSVGDASEEVSQAAAEETSFCPPHLERPLNTGLFVSFPLTGVVDSDQLCSPHWGARDHVLKTSCSLPTGREQPVGAAVGLSQDVREGDVRASFLLWTWPPLGEGDTLASYWEEGRGGNQHCPRPSYLWSFKANSKIKKEIPLEPPFQRKEQVHRGQIAWSRL